LIEIKYLATKGIQMKVTQHDKSQLTICTNGHFCKICIGFRLFYPVLSAWGNYPVLLRK